MKAYNLTALKEWCGNDPGFFNEMLEIFERSSNEGIAKMQEAYNANDFEMVKHYAHKIISPYRHIEANSIVEKLKLVEELAGENTADKNICLQLITEISSASSHLTEDLKKEHL
jgi:HPt (histidine-containing phosphotransfer) domain-containing protein